MFSLTKKDFEVQTFRAGGKGGQNQNKRDSGVRIIHHASGARGESREYRGQLQNKKAAFRRLIESEKFKVWHRIQCGIVVADLEERMSKLMSTENLKIEVKKNGKWVEI